MATPSIPLEAELTLFRNKLSGFKRRRSRRFRCGLATLGRIQFANRGDLLDAFVYNLSENGIGLNMTESLESGQEIMIRIRVASEPEPYQLDAVVVHCTQEVDRSWRVGCEFPNPLSPDVVDKILG